MTLVEIMRNEIIRQAKADNPDAPWIDPESDTFFRIDGPVNLVLLAEAVTTRRCVSSVSWNEVTGVKRHEQDTIHGG
jgi:hypothetical protein